LVSYFCFCEARFILSDDDSWPSTGVGPKSSIDYGDAFNAYKRFIIIGRHKEESRRSIELLFQRWDDEVFPKKAKVTSDLGMDQDVEVVEERRSAEFTDFFNRMQLEDNDASQLSNNSESMYITVAEEMQAHPQPRPSGSSGAVQAIASGAAAPTITIPAAPTIPAAVDRSLQAVEAPSKSKARPKPKPKNVPASKKAQNMLETPQVGVGSGAVVDAGFVVIDEVDTAVNLNGGQPAGKATRSRGRKGKDRAV
jgi:hypothetical protein